MALLAKIAITTHLPVPVGHPRHPGSILGVPLWCGRPWTDGTSVTYSPERVTCKKCAKLHATYQEELDHKRNMEKLATMRELEAAAE